jgi:HPt (histidine-containing phosphotransfer) domain-containing protein
MSENTGQRIDRDRLEEIGMGDAEFTREIIDMLIEDGKERIRLIREAYNQQTWEIVGREAHSLKGAALNVGANSLAQLCATIDDTVRKLKIAIDATQIEQVESEFELVTQELRSIASESK